MGAKRCPLVLVKGERGQTKRLDALLITLGSYEGKGE